MVHVKSTVKFILWCAAITLIAAGLQLGLQAVFFAFGAGDDLTEFAAVLAGYAVSIAVLIKLTKNKDAAEKAPADKPLTVTVCVFFAAYPIVYYTFARLIFGGNSPVSPSYIEEYQSVLGFGFSLVKNAALIPVMEELLFRKLCFLRLVSMNAAAKIALSGTVFAVMHLPKGFYIGDVLISGLLLAVLYFLTDNLLYCVLAHSAHNLLAVVINRLNYERLIPWDYNTDLYVYPTWFSVLCALAIAAAGTAFVWRYRKIKSVKIL